MENNLNEPRKGISSSWIYLGIIALLLAAGIYLFLTKNRAEDENEDLTNQVNTVSSDKATVETSYNAALARLDEMKNQSVQMDSLLTQKGQEVEELKNKIKAILTNKNATDAQLKEANKMIAELNQRLNGYQSQITALKQENVALTEEKKELITEKNQLQEEKTGLTEEKKELQGKVELGSVLHASAFKMEAINQKKNLFGKEKEVETGKAKRADLIRISFDLDDNRISESGEKIIYICVYDPSGNIASADGTPNSKFKTADGSDKLFTATKTVPYKKGEKVNGLACDWKPLGDFFKGNYKVEVYHMGYKIGSETVSLK
jgi:myosin heavy subunit